MESEVSREQENENERLLRYKDEGKKRRKKTLEGQGKFG